MTKLHIAVLMPRLTIAELELLRDAPYESPIVVRWAKAKRLIELKLLQQDPTGSFRNMVRVVVTDEGSLAARPLSLAGAAAIVAAIEDAKTNDADEAAELARLFYHRVLIEGALMTRGDLGPYTFAKLVALATEVSELVFLP